MEAIKKRRAVMRTAFTRLANELGELLTAGGGDRCDLQAKWDLLQQRSTDLADVDGQAFEQLMQDNAPEEQFDQEVSNCEQYTLTFNKLRIRYNNLVQNDGDAISGQPTDGDARSVSAYSNAGASRKFKLPTLEFKKFGGDVRDWLPFWSQFKKIDADEDIVPEDKFQYLLLAITPKTRARELVESYPPTAENYTKVIESLKSRFGREDLLVEVYVRELLKLVLNNAFSSQTRCSISTLYDKIETQLRALETLGIATDTCAAMLYPLVESCLPEELLRVWQRSTDFTEKPDSTLKTRLTKLMSFMKIEVESEERISLAVEGFGLTAWRGPKSRTSNHTPTAAGLMNCDGSNCLFCDGTHATLKCFKAQKMSLEQKRTVLIDKRACFKCASLGHRSRRCPERLKCVMCGGRHIVLLCPNLKNKESNARGKTEIDPEVKAPTSTEKAENSLPNHTDTEVFLQTARVKIRNDAEEYEIRAVFDSGSQRSYLLKSTAQQMKYSVKRKQPVIHALFGGVQTTEQQHNCYDVRLMNLNGNYSCKFEVLDQETICNDISPVMPGVWTEELQQAKIHFTDTQGGEPIELLIGADVYGRLITGKRRILQCGLVAVKTLLGWVLMGKVPERGTRRSTTMTVQSLLSKEIRISDFWKLETIGITDPAEGKSKRESEIAVKEHFLETVAVDSSGRYEVQLPWLVGHPPIPRNLELAEVRLRKTIAKLNKENLLREYGQVFQEWLREGIIEVVPSEEIDNTAHYLPHRPVLKPSSTTTKIRPVFDASAHEQSCPSLNCCLETGENLIEVIPAVILKFRLFRYGMVADICKAFLQIAVAPRDIDYLRFLWMTDEETIVHLRHKRVVFGLCYSPFLLGAIIQFHLTRMVALSKTSNISQTVFEKLRDSFYVDNCLTSVSSEAETEKFQREASQIMAEGQFQLRGWELTNVNVDENECSPLLGMQWNRDEDTLSINFDHIKQLDLEKISKRNILSLAQRIFDPMGFLCPALLVPKLLLQRTWETKTKWDDEVDDAVKTEFIQWYNELHCLTAIQIPRWINGIPGQERQWSLHTFVDASKEAYAAAVFLRVVEEEGTHVHLLQAKTRVAPLKSLTIPRLELLAATIGARLYHNVIRALKIRDIKSYFWSDSSTVIAWIQCEEQWATFVWNRVQEIRLLTRKDDWRHVAGILNPADVPSRGCSPPQLLVSRWWEGPSWLYEDPSKWPSSETEVDEHEINVEKKKKVIVATVHVKTDVSDFYKYFSSYDQVVRMVAWVQRFIHNANKSHERRIGELTSGEYDIAEKTLLKLVKKEIFGESIDKQLSSLKTFKDKDGLFRLKTRISNRDDTEEFRFPILLPSKHCIVARLIRKYHLNYCHAGTQAVRSMLREKYWILGCRKSVRNIVKNCTVCRRQMVQPLQIEAPSLPADRVRNANTFEIIGVDLAGPVYIQSGGKAWICLFTCAVYRAVHLELVTSLSTNGFLQAFRRFIARRGRPSTVYCDNGTNFVGSRNALDQIDWSTIEKFSSVKRITWRFSPPSAAWWGGWWERLIGLLKNLLKRVLGRASLNYEEFSTVLCDCESVMNSRPLTYVTNDPNDLDVLTPAKFLRETEESGVPDLDVINADTLGRRFRYLRKVRDDLRQRFRSEYLGYLRQSVHKRSTRSVAMHEIVLIGDDIRKRINWPMGRVVELIPGQDGIVRLVRVKTAKGILLRPIQRLHPLEANPVSNEPGVADVLCVPDADETPGHLVGGDSVVRSVGSKACRVENEGSNCKSGPVKVTRTGRRIKPPQKYYD